MFSLKYLTVFAFAACNLTLILARPRPGKTNSETDLGESWAFNDSYYLY